jgi:hypothetical protein
MPKRKVVVADDTAQPATPEADDPTTVIPPDPGADAGARL